MKGGVIHQQVLSIAWRAFVFRLLCVHVHTFVALRFPCRSLLEGRHWRLLFLVALHVLGFVSGKPCKPTMYGLLVPRSQVPTRAIFASTLMSPPPCGWVAFIFTFGFSYCCA